MTALFLLVAAPFAHAVKTTDSTFGGTGTLGGQFAEIRDIAVYEGTLSNPAPVGYAGDLYVVDRGGNRIQRLSSTGTFELAFGRDVIASGKAGDLGDVFERCTVAADCKAGSVGTAADGPSGEFSSPQGIAVNQDTGAVYVWDRTNRRVQQFDKDGNFVRMWGRDVVTTGKPNNVSTTAFEVCDVTNGNVAADCKQGTAGTAAGEFGTTSPSGNNGIAVQPGTGDVFVIDPQNRRFQKFEANGSLPVAIGSSAVFGTGQPEQIAADASGIVYASNSNGGNQVERYDTNASAFIAPISGGPGGVMQSGAVASGIEADPLTGNLLVARGSAETGGTAFAGVRELDIPTPATDPVTTLLAIHQPLGGFAVNGMGADASTGRIYLSTNATSNRIVVLDADGAPAPILNVLPSTDVEATTATLNATINPNGVGLDTLYRFELSTDGNSWNPVATEVNLGEGNTPISVDDPATGLEPNTLYRVRVRVVKPFGAGTYFSAEGTFVTDAAAPEALTAPIGPRTDTGAELRGTVDPNGSATTYFFQYGTTTTYGTNVPSFAASAGSGNAPLPVAQAIGGLQPSTTYHYRVVADGFGPPVFGADQTFVTKPTPTVFPAQGNRGAELVTPPVKMTGPGVGGHGSNSRLDGEMGLLSGIASLGGDRLLSQTQNGPVLAEGATVVVHDTALSERRPAGWVTHSAFNRPNYSSVTSSVPFLDLRATNSDLSLMLFDVTGGITFLFPEMDAPSWYAIGVTPKYLRDWSGNWEVIQPTDPVQGYGGGGGGVAALSADGTLSAFTARDDIQGVLGASDPSLDQVDGRNTYLQDVSAGLTDTFAGSPRLLLGICSGDGADRTVIPERLASGKLAAQTCPAPNPGRSAALTSNRGAALAPTTDENHPVRNIVSADGSRVFFMSPDPSAPGTPNACSATTGPATACPPQLFVSVRDGGGERAVRWISKPAVANQDASLLGPTYFEGASADGDKVFFRTTSPLTADDPNGLSVTPTDPRPIVTGSASANSWDLYMYDFTDDPGDDPGAGALTRISAGPTGNADSNLGAVRSSVGTLRFNIGGSLRFVSTDGARSYFATSAPLPGVPATADGTITSPAGTPTTTSAVNLYYYDTAKPLAQRWQFVALLPSGEGIAACASTAAGSGQSRNTGGALNNTTFGYEVRDDRNCVRGTDDGRFITFWTDGRLTADDPDAVTGDMYGFDAVAEDLTRLSASQGGLGGTYPCRTISSSGASSALPPDQLRSCFGDGGFVSGAPGRQRTASLGVATEPAASGDRIAYFQSRSQLVAEDLNDEMDVYQWRNGDLSLVSSGAADSEGSYYSGNSADGQDVFIVTRDVLTWQDIDGVRDVYDLRIGGGIPEPLSPPACQVLADGCQAAPAGVPATASASTAVFQGSGNVVEKPKPRRCVKGKVRRKGKCVTKTAKRTANKTRRAGK